MQDSDFEDDEALQRREQIAAILLRGVLRYLGRHVPQAPANPSKIADSGKSDKLQICRATRGPDGINN